MLGRAEAVGQVEGVGADRLVVPAAAGDEVHRLGLAAHDPPAVRPEDAGLRVGHGQRRGRRPPPYDAAPASTRDTASCSGESRQNSRVSDSSVERRLGDVARHDGCGPLPAAQDLGPDQRLGPVAVLDERGPGAHGVEPAPCRSLLQLIAVPDVGRVTLVTVARGAPGRDLVTSVRSVVVDPAVRGRQPLARAAPAPGDDLGRDATPRSPRACARPRSSPIGLERRASSSSVSPASRSRASRSSWVRREPIAPT